MISSKFLKIRDRVDLQLIEGDKSSIFSVRIQDITPAGIYVDRPIIDRRLFALSQRKAVTILFFKHNASFRFTSKVLSETKINQLPVMLLQHPSEIERIQRRKQLRVDLKIAFTYYQTSGPGGGNVGVSQPGTIINLSAGGIKFTVFSFQASTLKIGSTLKLRFTISDEFLISGLEAEVLKIEQELHSDSSTMTIMCRFLNISAEIKEAIIVHNIRTQRGFIVEQRRNQ